MNKSVTLKAPYYSLRETIPLFLVDLLKPFYLFLKRNRKPWNISMLSLSKMANGTLGNDLFLFLSQNNLKIVPRVEFHDVYHVLFGLDTTIKSETILQFIPLGNGKRSLPYLASTLVSILFFPEFWEDYYKAYKKGKNATTFCHWDFEKFLHLPTNRVKEMIFHE